MYLAELSTTQNSEVTNVADGQYWSQCHQKFSKDKINSMLSWLINFEKIIKTISKESQNVNINLEIVLRERLIKLLKIFSEIINNNC